MTAPVAHASRSAAAARAPKRSRLRVAGALTLIAAVLVCRAHQATGAGRVYRNEAYRILALEIPRGWVQAPQVAWPRVLVLASGSGKAAGAKLVVAAQRVVPGQDALGLAAEARAALLKQRFREPRVSDRSPGTGGESRSQIDAAYEQPGERGTLVMRQLYVVSGDVAVVLTVTAPPATAQHALADLALLTDSLVIAPAPLGAPTPEAPRLDESPDGGGG